MQELIKTVSSVAVLSIVVALIVSIIPCSAKLKKSLTVLTGLMCVMIIIPLFKANIFDFDLEYDTTEIHSESIDRLLSERITESVKSEINGISEPILKKYGVSNAQITLDIGILSESGIFINSINYIISDGLSSTEAMASELSSATGCVCTVTLKEE